MEPAAGHRTPWWRSKTLRKGLAWLMVLGALFFLYRLLRPDLPLIGQSLAQTHWSQIALASLVAMAMYLCQALYHLNVLASMRDGRICLRPDLPVYLQSQVIRYLPGRIWGVVYQSQRMLGLYRPSEIVVANFWQMMMTNLVAVGVIICILLAYYQSLIWLALLLPVLGVAEWLHRRPWLASWTLAKLKRTPPGQAAPPRVDLRPVKWRGTGLLALEWVFYLLVFVVILHDKADGIEVASLAAWYGGATLLALAVFFVPGGFAVREAIFIGVPVLGGVEPALLTVAAALTRAIFLFAELAMAALATPMLRGGGNG